MKDYLRSWKYHFSQKIKGIKYSDKELGDLLKKEMKKKHNSRDICQLLSIEILSL